MRGARLLQCLLLLQNRGRMTSGQLAEELEVSQRTILRDLDAMTEAGLPVIVYQGSGGGIELGFNYRTRLTALTEDEAEALGIVLSNPHPALSTLGLETSAKRAFGKIIEQQSEPVRRTIKKAQDQFELTSPDIDQTDPRPEALVRAIRNKHKVTLQTRSNLPVAIEPVKLHLTRDSSWQVTCQKHPSPFPQTAWGDIAVSAKTFT